ncbi:MAG: pyridoxine 5'-phosphate synthase [Phycisphaerae bacterium]|nr:pyridoxine 5'-phosphate synthase [Phycisphaerae bacterium]
MTQLSVNVNKIALLRNQRDLDIPSVVHLSRICLSAGAVGITVHPRPDQRHIRPGDVWEIAELAAQTGAELNIEGNPFSEECGSYPGFMDIVRRARPTQCTLVPDSPDQSTSDHGWDVKANAKRLQPIVTELQTLNSRVSLFVDPDPAQMSPAAGIGADRVELYTEPYARAFAEGHAEQACEKYAAAAAAARDAGLGLNAGHDLNLKNLAKFVTIPGVLEVSIGHALIAEALEMGLDATVRAYVKILSSTK